MKITALFEEFFHSEKASGVLLLVCTVVSLLLANFIIGPSYADAWSMRITLPAAGISFSLISVVNDALMAVFFLLVGLEIEREIYVGELSTPKSAALPFIAAIGGSVVPPAIHLAFNYGLPSQPGAGIPMATDIAFAIGLLSLAGKSVPFSLKVFLTALAIIDDLLAIIVISLFYSDTLSFWYLGLAALLFLGLCAMNRIGVNRIWPYIAGGVVLWVLLHNSGIHATIAGVLLAFALPFRDGKEHSPSYRVQRFLHFPVAFGIMPIFALANTGIAADGTIMGALLSPNGLGIIAGLIAGKTIGIAGAVLLAHKTRIAIVPADWRIAHVIGVGFFCGVGFTMSIFISMLAFEGNPALVDSSKIAVLCGSALSALFGFAVLKLFLRDSRA